MAKNDVIRTGFLDSKMTAPYVLIEGDYIVDAKECGDVFDAMDDSNIIDGGNTFVTNTSSVVRYGFAKEDVPAFYKDSKTAIGMHLSDFSLLVDATYDSAYVSASTLGFSVTSNPNSRVYRESTRGYGCFIFSFGGYSNSASSDMYWSQREQSTHITLIVGRFYEYRTYIKILKSGDMLVWTNFNEGDAVLQFGIKGAGSIKVSNQIVLEHNKIYRLRTKLNMVKGTVYDAAGKPVAGCPVHMHSRESGKIVGKSISDASGKYEVQCAAGDKEVLYGVCLDNPTAPDFEAIIIDRIVIDE